ncbi:MAG TPA: iron ABC transporter permease [Acidimicrobiales bacterium]|nr:iron ABC transporter permease [Acidimicrobiales bacterium]
MASVAERPAPARAAPGAPRTLTAAAAAVGALFALPLAYVAVRAAAGDLAGVLTSRSTVEPALRSLALAGAVSASCAVTGTAMAWFTVRTDLPLRRFWRLVAPLPLVIPSFVGASALLAAFARGGLVDQLLEPLGVDRLPQVRGFWGAFAVLTLLSYPYVYLPVAARLAGLPASLEESARLLGKRTGAVFRTVVLPQAARSIAAGTMLVFLYALSDFGAVSLLRYRTLTDRIFATKLIPATSMVLSLVLGALAVAVVLIERAVAGRTRAAASSSGRSVTVRMGRGRWAALGFVGAVCVLALGAPVVVLAFWALRGLRGGGSLLGSVGGSGFDDLPALMGNSAVAGVVTAVVAVAVVLPVAYLVARHRSRMGAVAQALVTGGFALPGLVGALALARLALDAPLVVSLYQTFPLLVAAYVLHFGAQASQAAQVAVGAVPPSYADAARMLGASRWRALATVELPLMLPGLLAGAGLVLLSTMKELPATLLLAPFDFQTLATRVWLAANDGFLAEAGLVSLVLIAVSGVLTWLLVIRAAYRRG